MNTNLQDRGHLLTEQRLAASARLDALDTRAVLELMNDEDAGVAGAVRRAIPSLEKLVDLAVKSLGRGGRLIYVGAGTSGRLGVLDASECPPTFHCEPGDVVGIIAGGDGALRKSAEGAEDDPTGVEAEFERLNVDGRDTVVAIAAGGTTPYCWGAVERAKARDAATGFMICVPFDSLKVSIAPDVVVELLTGPEVVTGSTRMKAGTATKLALNMLSTATMVRLGKTWGNLMIDLRATNAKLVDRAARIVMGQTGLDRAAALRVLEASGGRVKRALVMARLGCDVQEADAKLDATRGQLRPLLGAPR